MHAPRRTLPLLAAALLVGLVPPAVAGASPPSQSAGEPRLLIGGLEGGSGSAVGPDGALYVTESGAGRLSRIDPESGEKTVVATCLPERVAPFPGGAVDVTFKHGKAYVLVTLVSTHVGGTAVAGIYRIDGPDECTVIADLGTWSADNPPPPDVPAPVVPGVQFALESYRGGFLVTDGHHNRVLFVQRNGEVHQLIQLPNVVPTGLDVKRSTVFLALAGPTPHNPEDGRIVSFRGWSPELREVASGAPLLVDVERCGHRLFGLAQGEFPVGQPAGSPANADTGELRVADRDGHLRLLVDGLDQPASLTFIGHAAYVVTLSGELWKIPHVCRGHHDHEEDADDD